MTRAARIAVYALSGFAVGLAAALVAVIVLTHSDFGREQVRRFGVKWLADRIEGELRVGSVGGTGLLGSMTLHDLEIRSRNGRPFVRADSARLTYKWRSLLRRQFRLNSAQLYQPQVVIEKLPNDTAWNYEHIFVDRTPGESSGKRRLIEIDDARIYNGRVIVRTPLDTGEPIEVKDTARSVIEAVPGGLARVLRFDSVRAEFDRILWESPLEEGRLIQMRSLAATAYVWKDPVRVRRLEGQVVLRDSIIAFDLPRVDFGGSNASVQGRLIDEDDGLKIDVAIDGRKLAFADLLWIYPELPAEGNANLKLRIQTQPRGTLFYASNASIVAPGTRLSGNFGVVTGDTMYFTDVDLRASPMNLELFEKILGDKLPVQGLMVGTVEIKGPISRLDTSGDIQFTPAGGKVPAHVKWQGTFDARAQLAATGLKADVRNLDLALLSAFNPELQLKGVVNGRVEADGVLAERVRFAADLQHVLSGLSSRVEGGGSYDSRGRLLDLRVHALPISFADLASAYPALQKLKGEARGPITASGTPDSLRVEAHLTTQGGLLDFAGTLQMRDGRRRYAGEGRVSGFRLDDVWSDLPGTNLSGTIRFDLAGKSAEDVSGTLSAQLDSARLTAAALKDVRLEARVGEGVLAVDTMRARSVLGDIAASGDFGISAGRSGTLRFTLQGDSTLPADTATARAGGRLAARGTVRGGLGGFDLGAEAQLQPVFYRRAYVGQATLRLNGHWLATDSSRIALNLEADSTDFYGERLDSVVAELTYGRNAGQLAVFAAGRERTYRGNGDLRFDSATTRLFVRQAEGGLSDAPWVLSAPFGLQLSRTGMQADSFAFQQTRGGGSATGMGRLAWARSRDDSVAAADQPLDFKLALRRAPLSDYLRFIRENTGEGQVDADIALSGTAGDPIIGAGFALTNLRHGDARFDRLEASFGYAEHLITGRVEGHQNGRRVLSGEGTIPVDLGLVPLPDRTSASALEFAFRADSMPAGIFTGLLPGFSNVTGSVAGNIDLRGTTRDPAIAGLLTLSNGGANYRASGVRYRNVSGTFTVLNDSVVAIDANARAGEGSAALTGQMVFANLANPRFDNLIINANNFLAADRRDARLTTTGRMMLGGFFRAPELSGAISVDRGTLFLDELYRQVQVVDLDPSSPLFFAVIDTSQVSVKRVLPATMSPFVRNLRITDLSVDVGRESWLRSQNLNVEVSGRLLVSLDRSDPNEPRNVEDIRLTGDLSAVRGVYQMKYGVFTRRFDIRQGTVLFPGTPGLDPSLDFTALYRARPLEGEPIDIMALVSGTLLSPRIRLSSDEDSRISESDLASYLFFGVPTSALSLSQSRTLNASGLLTSAATSSVLGYLAGGLQTWAQNFGFDYVSLTTAEGVTESGGPGLGFNSFLNGTQFEVGRYFSRWPNLFFVYSNRVAAGTPMGVGGGRVEWRFHPTYTIELFAEDRFARGRAVGIENTAGFRKVYGFFLFREWGF